MSCAACQVVDTWIMGCRLYASCRLYHHVEVYGMSLSMAYSSAEVEDLFQTSAVYFVPTVANRICSSNGHGSLLPFSIQLGL